jgi:excisionase family DNA binding protein
MGKEIAGSSDKLPIITPNDYGEAFSVLMGDVKWIKDHLTRLQPIEVPVKRRPIRIDEASKILGVAKVTVYRLCSNGKLISYKQGKKLYFYENELLDYIGSGMKKSFNMINNQVDSQLSKLKISK